MLVGADHPCVLLKFLADDIAENAAVFIAVVGFGAVELGNQHARQYRQGNELRMAMLQRGSGRLAVIFENHHVTESGITLEILDPVPVGPENQCQVFGRQVVEHVLVIRTFDDHLVSPNAVHPVIEPFGFLAQFAFDLEGRVFIGNYPHLPAGPVTGGGDAMPVGQYFRRGKSLVAGAERTKPANYFGLFDDKIVGPLSPLLGNDDPASKDRVSPELGHKLLAL